MARALWWRWVVANAAGEVVGFGGAAAVGASAAMAMGPLAGGVRLAALLATVAAVGSLEGACVGLAQWLVLREPLPAIRRWTWILATIAGAVIAWGAGMAVGTSMGDSAAGAEPAAALMIAGGAGIGAGAGVILALPQWLVLRRVAAHAGWWVPVHALAWAAGMLIAFAGMAVIDDSMPAPLVATLGGGTGLAMGGLVAALTGVAVLRLVPHDLTRVCRPDG